MLASSSQPIGPLLYTRMKSIRSVPEAFSSVCEPVTTAVASVKRTSAESVFRDRIGKDVNNSMHCALLRPLPFWLVSLSHSY